MRRTIAIAPAAALLACGGSSPQGPAPTPVTVLERTAETGAWTHETARPLAAAPTALGVEGEHHAVVIVGGVAHLDVGDQFEARPLYAEGPDPTSMGQARVVRPRSGGGAWIGGSAGLFVLERHFVTRSPLSDAAADVLDVAQAASGPLAGVWLLARDGLWWQHEGGLEQVALDLADPEMIAVDAQGRHLLVASRGDLRLVEKDGAGLTALDLDLETGDIRRLAGGAGRTWVGAEGGLFETDGSTWTHHRLGEVLDLAADPATGDAWARSARGLEHVGADRLVRYQARAEEQGLAVDRFGDVHTLNGSAVISRGTGAAGGEAVTFADVKPWLATHCSQCHQNQTADFEVYEVFAERAEDALARVRAGDMPRCTGSVRCDAEDALSPSDYAVLEQWIRDGMPE